MHSVPPTNVGANLYRLLHGKDLALAPGQRELLPVLWDMGILPDVHVLGPSDFIAERARFPGREEAIASVVPGGFQGQERERALATIGSHFDEIFVPAEQGYRRRPIGISRVLLITWEPTANP